VTGPQLLGSRYGLHERLAFTLGLRYIHTRNTVDKRARDAAGWRARCGEGRKRHWEGRVGELCSRMGLIQVQRQCRRLYDDEEHLGDRRACNFLVTHRHRTCTPLCMRDQHISNTYTNVHVSRERCRVRVPSRHRPRLHGTNLYLDADSRWCVFDNLFGNYTK